MWLAIILVGFVAFLLYYLLQPPKDFWKAYGIRQINVSGFSDNIQVITGKKTLADLDTLAYTQLGPGKFCGMVQMQQPVLLVKDMEVLKKLLIKDFNYFVDRRPVPKTEKMLKNMLINMEGEEWKGVRTSLSPTFTTGKIRRMMEVFNRVSNEWVEHLKDETKAAPSNVLCVNIPKETLSFTLQGIATAVFGMNASAIRDPNSIFAKMFGKISRTNLLAIIKFGLANAFPKLVEMLGISLMDEEAMNFFETILSQGMKSRMEGRVKQNDFLQLLAEARRGDLKAVGSDELSAFEKDALIGSESQKKINYINNDDIANAQGILFLFAGASTTSNFLGFALYMLALYPEVQEKLREELNSQLFNEGDGTNVDYDELTTLPYLEMVVCETLRKFPALGRIERKCVKDYHDPSENLRVPKGAIVGIPVEAIHNDKQYYDHPDKFYPEHFAPENKAKRNPYAYLPFGVGPRNCIGMRFALVEGKAALAHLVHNFIVEPTAKTPIPYQVKPVGIGAQLPDNLELGFKLAR